MLYQLRLQKQKQTIKNTFAPTQTHTSHTQCDELKHKKTI